jgi:hypothetical protein
MVLLLSTAVFSITRSLEAEPLLACVTAGMLLANRRWAMMGAWCVCRVPARLFACQMWGSVCMRGAGCCTGNSCYMHTLQYLQSCKAKVHRHFIWLMQAW